MAKVVYNAAPSGNGRGGFGLSRAATERLAALGLPAAQHHIAAGVRGGFYDVDRHDPRLVRVVEEMGASANGDDADLRIAVSDDWRAYDIHSTLDGREQIHWIKAEGIAPEGPDERDAILAFLRSEERKQNAAADASQSDDSRSRCSARAGILRTVVAYIERGDHLTTS